MFKLNPAPTFKATVRITVPGGDALPVEFEFRHKTRTGLAAWQDGIAGKADRDLVPEFVVGWSGVINETGDQEPYSVDAFVKLCENYPAAALEVFAGYIKALTESRAKN